MNKVIYKETEKCIEANIFHDNCLDDVTKVILKNEEAGEACSVTLLNMKKHVQMRVNSIISLLNKSTIKLSNKDIYKALNERKVFIDHEI